jgi:1-acyl-sn-glycerol-3-phosphate acyltransferase
VSADGSPGRWRAFEWGFRPWLRTRIGGIHLAGVPSDPAPARPLLLVANHTSWYDGFLLREIHRRIRPGGPLRTLMLERELRKAPVLRWIGGIGFDPERPLTLRGALGRVGEAEGTNGGTPDSGARIRPAPTLSFFPQGTITPSTRRPLGFRRGVELVMRRLAPATVLPVAIRLEMGRKVRPEAWLLAGDPLPVDADGQGPGAAELEARVTALLERVADHLHAHGEGAEAAWPPSAP